MNKYAQFSKAKQKAKKYLKERSCERKKKYETIDEAKQDGAQLTYQCKYCGKFHATASIFKRRKK